MKMSRPRKLQSRLKTRRSLKGKPMNKIQQHIHITQQIERLRMQMAVAVASPSHTLERLAQEQYEQEIAAARLAGARLG